MNFVKIIIFITITSLLISCNKADLEKAYAARDKAVAEKIQAISERDIAVKALDKLNKEAEAIKEKEAKVIANNKAYTEDLATTYNFSIYSISFLRVIKKNESCEWAKFDTQKGPKWCLVGSIVKNTKDEYLVSSYRPGLSMAVDACNDFYSE
jgi:pyruvate/oxaloacetate carboxyltransferase